MKTFTLRKNGAVTRKDMAMSKAAIAKIGQLKGTDKLLESHYKQLLDAHSNIQAFMEAVDSQITNWSNFKKVFAGKAGGEVEMDVASIDARVADLKALHGQLANAFSRVNTALKQKSALPQKLKEFTNTVAKFT